MAPSTACGTTSEQSSKRPLSFRHVQVMAGPGGESAGEALASLAPQDGQGGAPLPAEMLRVVAGGAPGSPAWQLAEDAGLDPGALPPEGYALLVTTSPDGPLAVLAGADPAGACYAAGALVQMIGTAPSGVRRLPQVALRTWPALPWRGVVEGFYGTPWTHADRLDCLRFAARHGLNCYVYAPKDDPYHRERWREPYPPAELDRIRELVQVARSRHVRFVHALAPGLSMVYSDPAEHALLLAKADQLWDAGVRHFSLLFDDIPEELQHAEDVAAFGGGPGAAGSAHASVCTHFAEFLDRRGAGVPLSMCPTDYAGTASSPYREHLARELRQDVLVWWTGRDVVVGEVPRRDIDAAAASYGHRLLLWDNFPVNDFDRSRLFLGPLTGRAADVSGSALAGICANPMIEAAPSQLALTTVARYAWDPAGYDPTDAARQALALVGGEDATRIAPLVAACNAWPPSAPQSAELGEWIAAALDGDPDAAESLLTAFALLDDGAQALRGRDTRLVEQLRPWLEASAATAHAGGLAVRLLRTALSSSTCDDNIVRGRQELELALAQAEAHEANVLRSHVPAFVRTVLERSRRRRAS